MPFSIHGNKEFNLKAKHDEELRQAQIQAETELKEVPTDTIRGEATFRGVVARAPPYLLIFEMLHLKLL